MKMKTLLIVCALSAITLLSGCAQEPHTSAFATPETLTVHYRTITASEDLTFEALDVYLNWQEFDAESTITTGSSSCLNPTLLAPVIGQAKADAIGTWYCATGDIDIPDEYIRWFAPISKYIAAYRVKDSSGNIIQHFAASQGDWGMDCFEDLYDADNTLDYTDYWDMADDCDGRDHRNLVFDTNP